MGGEPRGAVAHSRHHRRGDHAGRDALGDGRAPAAGRSDADIDRTLVSEYGQTILLVPPDAGGVPLIWIIPLVLGAGALVGVGVLFWRRSREFGALQAEEVEA